MTNSMEDRFMELAMSYYRAAKITDGLFLEKVLEQKIKMNFLSSNPESDRKYLALVSIIAEIERNFESSKHEIDGGYRDVVADSYFRDFEQYGDEWVYADLRPKFEEWKELAQEQIKASNENY